MDASLDAKQWGPAVDFFRGGVSGGIPMTLARINLIKGLGQVLQIAEGYSVELDPEVHDILDQCSNPT